VANIVITITATNPAGFANPIMWLRLPFLESHRVELSTSSTVRLTLANRAIPGNNGFQ
jgi:hypothetical protein